jgi:dTDP-4-dehydrorhamnose reductase
LVSLLTGPVLITGGSGQLGQALVNEAGKRGIDFVAVSRPDFDFDVPATIDACFASAKPSLVVNAAAYTAVDAAETNVEAADRANHIGPARLAELCAAAAIPLIHISTDYVFDGAKGSPYLETDRTGPAGVYGASKRAGELAVLAIAARTIILRTAWVYSAHGKNFARTLLAAARKTTELRVVMDQKGTPTAAPDLAAAILDIASLLATGWKPNYRGIFHATSAGETSWHGFAAAILAAAEPA